MGIVTVKAGNDGSWPNARPVATGHFATYYPEPRILRLHDPNGAVIAETGVGEGVRDFSAYIATNGEVRVLFASYNNDKSPWPWKRWDTGAFVGATTAPPPTQANTAIKAAIVQKANEIEALANQIK